MRLIARLPTLLTNIHIRRYSSIPMAAPSPPVIIAGVGPGTGASVARRFATTYPVVLLARNPDNYNSLVEEIQKKGGWAKGISTDVSDVGSVKAAFEELEEIAGGGEGKGKVAAAVFNVGGRFIRKPFLELTQEEFESGWDANGYVLTPVSLNSTGCLLIPPSPSPSPSLKP